MTTIMTYQPIGGQLHAITTDNDIIPVEEIKGAHRVGAGIEEVDGVWSVASNNVDVDCPGGVCPIK